MGKNNTKLLHRLEGPTPSETITFDDFEVLRAIGKGAFGKVKIAVELLKLSHEKENTSRKEIYSVGVSSGEEEHEEEDGNEVREQVCLPAARLREQRLRRGRAPEEAGPPLRRRPLVHLPGRMQELSYLLD